MSRFFCFLILIFSLSPSQCDDCESVHNKLVGQMSQLSIIGVMEELLYIVVHYGITNVSLYQVPVSQLHSTEVSLIGVSAITLEHKWPYLNDYPQLEDLKQQMYTKTGLATIRGGPTLMYFAGYNESGIMCTDASCPKELHNIDTISVSVDPEWAFTMQLWQNAERHG
ncbi:hypothetical protein TYRP_008223 [Tyrophagus putrescentiae]|nr:hypothetical protein TYRP_008223 [Tyrophagus putrescentiae]